MRKEVTMPQLGESVTEGTISQWLVKPGDKVKKYDPIAEVLSDKVSAEIPSSYTGEISELVAEENETVAVGTLICYMETEETQPDIVEKASASYAETAPGQEGGEEEKSMKKRYSPVVWRLAQENGLSLENIEGSGKQGRVTKKDVEKAIREGAEKTKQEEAAPSPFPIYSTKPSENQEEREGDTIIPVTGARKAIADNMVKSKQEIPHAWTMIEVDVTDLVAYRNSVKDDFKQKEGFSLTYLPFFMKAVSESLQLFPSLNSTWDGDRIIQRKEVNLSMAVASEEALYVPVIKRADEKNIRGLARDMQSLATKVRQGTIKAEEMKSGTFTVNNTGSFGSVQSMPIINHPQAAILSVESIVKRPVVMQGDMIAIRYMVNLCLSLDHRILDGLLCGRFLADLKQRLENYKGTENI
ncbi:branched-chain alpha-keto acid dehydrogenase subunit E2 [Marinococcus halophilus]|uniref:Dihydrolipoamide acetyltransferase component of pyruvate dehydrogenase complex n=1 Tax=Marinococcus halophilus TaxID=1371 RepID=A0A510Y7J1_MARHA|nr:dihydrolipoamide acetyltransferase family protein [Marinococcus halophilus]OZT80955.1 branched-chain alpha-keto acid dehydrogenase subunit E2 [Marinococcus halophilus]GEK59338.1 lipoamide acyltransferase component of branched-chain alpha-keto acid dehydrogenase complex [Marinococcus halophilus]